MHARCRGEYVLPDTEWGLEAEFHRIENSSGVWNTWHWRLVLLLTFWFPFTKWLHLYESLFPHLGNRVIALVSLGLNTYTTAAYYICLVETTCPLPVYPLLSKPELQVQPLPAPRKGQRYPQDFIASCEDLLKVPLDTQILTLPSWLPLDVKTAFFKKCLLVNVTTARRAPLQLSPLLKNSSHIKTASTTSPHCSVDTKTSHPSRTTVRSQLVSNRTSPGCTHKVNIHLQQNKSNEFGHYHPPLLSPKEQLKTQARFQSGVFLTQLNFYSVKKVDIETEISCATI